MRHAPQSWPVGAAIAHRGQVALETYGRSCRQSAHRLAAARIPQSWQSCEKNLLKPAVSGRVRMGNFLQPALMLFLRYVRDFILCHRSGNFLQATHQVVALGLIFHQLKRLRISDFRLGKALGSAQQIGMCCMQ